MTSIEYLPRHKKYNPLHFAPMDLHKESDDNSNRIEKLISEHLHHFKGYIHAPIDEKHIHLLKIQEIWRDLKAIGSTSEAHRRTLNYAYKLGLIRSVGIPR